MFLLLLRLTPYQTSNSDGVGREAFHPVSSRTKRTLREFSEYKFVVCVKKHIRLDG